MQLLLPKPTDRIDNIILRTLRQTNEYRCTKFVFSENMCLLFFQVVIKKRALVEEEGSVKEGMKVQIRKNTLNTILST